MADDIRDDSARRCAGRGRWLVAAVVGAAVTAAQAGVIALPAAQPQHEALAAHPAFAGVGAVRVTVPNGNSFLGSGTVVGGQYLLTAAHVVDRAAQLSFQIDGKTYDAQRWTIHPRWNGSNFNSGFDLAVVRLTEPVSGAPAVQLQHRPREMGKIVTIVGYGQGGTGDTGASTASGAKLAGQNRIELFTGGRDRLMQSTFHAPGDGALPLEFLPAPGDSGGGVFIGTKLAGIVSFLAAADGTPDASFGDTAQFVRISQQLDLIDQALRQLRNPAARRRDKKLPKLAFGAPGQPIFTDPVVYPPGAFAPLSSPASVPEPAAAIVLMTGMLQCIYRRRRGAGA